MESEKMFDYPCAGICECGPKRRNNQDNLLQLRDDGVFAIADGMGGASAGEVASYLVVDSMEYAMEGTWGDSQEKRKKQCQQALERAHEAIATYRDGHGYQSMGTTAVAILFNPEERTKADVMFCGDSRCYRYRKGELRQLTSDQNKANVPDNVSGVAGKRNELTNFVGIRRPLALEWRQAEAEPGDLFLLCSDGLYAFVPDGVIAQIVGEAAGDPQVAITRLQKAILKGVAGDNYSVICIVVPQKLSAGNHDAECEETRLYSRTEEVVNG